MTKDRAFGRAPRTVLSGIALILALCPLTASADIGTGVGANPLTLPQPAAPGHTYTLPSLYVINTGTEPSRYGVHVERLAAGEGRDVPAEWIEIGRNDFALAPKESTMIPLKLTVPANAASGPYFSYVVVGTLSPGETGATGAALGARAADVVRFTVQPEGALLTIPWPWPWWAYALSAMVVLLLGGNLVLRRMGLRLEIQRTR